MNDVDVSFRQGEAGPVFGTATAPTGQTLTIDVSPTVTLYDSAGAVVTGYNGIPVTGYDVAAAGTVRAWHIVDTAGLSAGDYTLVFTIQATGDDGLERTFRPAAGIAILTVPEALALADLAPMIAADKDPALSEKEVRQALAAGRIATAWQASTAYGYGDVVVGSTYDGNLWRVATPGTSDATEPDWTDLAYAYTTFWQGYRFTDGTVVWEWAGRGPADASLYDLNAAAAEAWRIKTNKAAERTAFSYGQANNSISAQHLYDHCKERAAYYAAMNAYAV